MLEKRSSLLIEQKTPIDPELWAIFFELDEKAAPIYDQLKVTAPYLETAKDAFFVSGRTTNPNLSLRAGGQAKKAALYGQEAEWTQLKQQIKSRTDLDMLLRHAYVWRINEIIANIRMAQASEAGDMRRFKAYNEFIYGQPDPEIFAATTDWFRQWASGYLNDESAVVTQAAQDVLDTMPELDGDKQLLVPPAEVFDEVRAQQFREDGYFTLIMAGVELPEGQKVSTEVGDPALRQVLDNIGATEVQLADASGAAWSNENSQNLFKRPAKYNTPYNRFIGLPVGHEARHRLEWENGLRQPVQLFAAGLDRYEKGNEGRAVLGEQVAYPTFEQFSKQLRWQDLMRRSLAISLAVGTDGQPRNFAEVFRIINSVDRLWERAKKPDQVEEADAKADQRTWGLLSTKAFKGTDGRGGVAYQKDNYLESNVKVWRQAAKDPNIIDAGDLGKFDITNPRHIQMAVALGALPEEATDD